MQLVAKFRLENIFKSKDFKDSKTGEVTPGKWKVQTFSKFDTAEGQQLRLIDITVPEPLALSVKDKVGKDIEIPVSCFAKGSSVYFYGV